MKNKLKIIDYGIACKIGETIYINKDIKKYPKLWNALLKHENEHTDDYGIKDILIDFRGSHLNSVKRTYYKFLLTHPRAWIQLLPIGVYDKRIIYDPVMMITWVMVITMIGIIIGLN